MIRFIFVLSLLFCQSSFAKEQRFLLENMRSEIRVPNYTNDQKRIVVEQALQIFQRVNTNETVKNAVHGNRNFNQGIIDDVSKNYLQMSSEEMILKLSSLYLAQFDDHLNFYFPPPYSCYTSELPFDLQYVTEAGRSFYVISYVSDFDIVQKDGTVTALPGFELMTVGDELVSYQGESIERFFEKRADLNQVPKVNFRARRERWTPVWRNHRVFPMPSEDKVAVQFRRANGTSYNVEFPWLVNSNAACLKPSPTPKTHSVDLATDLGVGSEETRHLIMNPKNFTGPLATGVNGVDWVMPVNTSNKYGWGYLTVGTKKYGYFNLTSFSPQITVGSGYTTDSMMVLREFRKIWETLNNDVTVKGLIIDVRNNVGGSLTLSSSMIQAFSPSPVLSSRFRLRNTEENLYLYRKIGAMPGYEDMNRQRIMLETSISTSSDYTDLFPLFHTSDALANRAGRIFFKPVVVFTNNACYSACDDFVGLMQDHKAAVIVGEDVQTGGGGANVWTHQYIQTTYLPAPGLNWETLPFGQNIRFPFRQFTRLGDPSAMVEDVGVMVDEVVSPTIADVLLSSKHEFEKLAAVIDRLDVGVYIPVPAEPGPARWLDIEKAQALSFQHAQFKSYSLEPQPLAVVGSSLTHVGYSANRLPEAVLANASFALHIKEASISKLSFDAELQKAETLRVFVEIRTSTQQSFVKVLSGSVSQNIEIPLPKTADGKVEVIFWTSSDQGFNLGKFQISNLQIL